MEDKSPNYTNASVLKCIVSGQAQTGNRLIVLGKFM